jgi:predicted ATPase/class 3 adenylate cyclase
MHTLVPGFILDRYRAGKYSGAFQAAGLFLDISGFSTMTDALMARGQHGAEVMAQIMRTVFTPLIRCIFEQGGFVAGSAGDSLTALFPADDGDGDSCALRAAAAAWNIQQEMAGLAQFHTPYQTFSISAKVGLAEGSVNWGIILAEESRRAVYFFQGPAVDESAQAQQKAQAGGIILTAELAEHLKETGTTEPVPASRYARLLDITGPLPPPKPVPAPYDDLQVTAHFFPDVRLDEDISGEFRQVVSMMINLPSVRTETQLRIFMESVFNLQDTYGGFINNLDFGDKGTNLVLYWGAPAAYENDIERALNFILDLQSSTSIPISAGVTYRISHAGYIGSRLYEEYTCFGRGVSLAARFMTAAPRGEIWIDEPAAQRASHNFDIQFIEERSFKGFQQPQKVYTLLERRELAQVFYQGQMVGRSEDLLALNDFLQPIFQQQFAGMLVISGEPGIGKSRLVHTFIGKLKEDQPGSFQVFLGQTDDIVHQALHPFAYWLRRYFGTADEQGEARSKRSFNRKLDDLIGETQDTRLADELDRTRSFLGALIGLYWPDSLYEQVNAQGRYDNTFIALASLLQAESQRVPVILVLEDIHQLDEDSRAFLPYLLRLLDGDAERPYPIALLCTSRNPVEDGWLVESGCSALHLQGLERPNLHALAAALLDGPPGKSLLDLLVDRAEGNPFYAEQILHFLKEADLLIPAGDGWAYRQGQIHSLPTDVNILLVARLDHLQREVKETVQTAAVLGREFDVQLLSCMLQNCQPPVMLSEVTTAEQEGIWVRLGEIRYLFKHILMREAAYQMQVHTRLQRLHALAVEAYETLYAERLPEFYSELAFHAEQAVMQDSALRYLKLAGEAAEAAYQNAHAVDYFTRALAVCREDDLGQRSDLLLAREKLYGRLALRADQQRDLASLEAMLPLLTRTDAQVEILLRHADLALFVGEMDDAGKYAGQALTQARNADLPEKEVQARIILANIHMRQGLLDQAEAQAKEALLLAQECGSQIEQLNCQNTLGLIAINQSRLDAAYQYFTHCLVIARELGNLNYQIAPLNNMGNVLQAQSDFSAALDSYQQTLAISRKVGDKAKEGQALINLGFISGSVGAYAAARTYLEQSLIITRESGNTFHEAYALMNLSGSAAALGDYETAERSARQAFTLAQKIGDRSGEAWAQTYLGHSLLSRGALDDAAAAYASALAVRGELGQPDLAAEPAAGLARTRLKQGDLPAAREQIEPVLAHLEAGGTLDTADEPLRVYLSCYLVLRQFADPRAHDLLATAHSLLHQRAARISSEETRRAFLTNIEHHREIESAWGE